LLSFSRASWRTVLLNRETTIQLIIAGVP